VTGQAAKATPLANKNGQVLGAKGRRSRERIVAETVALLGEMPVTDLSMAAIVRRAGITPAAYYLYFDDLGEAVLAALEDSTKEFAVVAGSVAKAWPAERVFDCALAFVHAYFDVWNRHMAVLRARNVLADSGDARFTANRSEATLPVVTALTAKLAAVLAEAPGAGFSPRVLANVLLTAIERSATVTALDLHGRSAESEETSRALAHLLEVSLRKAPPPSPRASN
jgi:AcrR family transcriptional regulator